MPRVVTTGDADEDIAEVDSWWREYRPKSRDLFRVELSAAFELLADQPFVGPPYADESVVGVRRYLLPGTRNHVFYCVVGDLVEVIGVHGATWYGAAIVAAQMKRPAPSLEPASIESVAD